MPMAGLAGFEPTTRGLENRCSILMSYRPVNVQIIASLHFAVKSRTPGNKDSKSWDRMLLACLCGRVFISRRGAEARSFGFEGKRPLSPGNGGLAATAWRSGRRSPPGFQATRWKRRIRIAPTATRGTDARPRTRIATKSIFAHISCEGLRHPSESRERTPVSNTCHSV